MNLGELFIELGVVGDVKPLKDALKTLKASVKETNQQIKANKEFAKGIGIIITSVTAAVVALDRMTNSLVKNNQVWVNFTRQTDLSLKSLQKYSGIASLLDKSLGMEGAAGSIEQLNKRLFELRLTGEGARGFQLAGVNPIGQDVFGVIEQLRSRFQGMNNTTATYLMEQMGLDPKLLPLIRLTREEFENLYNSIRNYQLTARQREEIQKMNIQLEIVATRIRYLKDRAILAIMPAFTKFMNSLARVTEGLAQFVKWIKDGEGWGTKLTKGILEVAAAVGVLTAALWAFSAHPIVAAITAIVGALYLLIDDIVGYFQGKNSGIGYIINFFDDLQKDFQNMDFGGIFDKLAASLNAIAKIPASPALVAISNAAKAISIMKNWQGGQITGGAASIGYAGALPDLSSSLITPNMQRNISNNSITNNYDNRQITQSNSIMTNQTVDTLYNELIFARNSMNAGFA